MKVFVCLGLLLLPVPPLHAETYSWIDDSGTHNYTEDFSRVPKKFQKKVKRSEDLKQDVRPQETPPRENSTRQAEKGEAKPPAVPDLEKEPLYGGKSHAAWRTELDILEAELGGIEQHLEQVKSQLYTKGISRVQFDALKKDYDESRAAYAQKYKSYSELIETVRKAGISVNIRK